MRRAVLLLGLSVSLGIALLSVAYGSGSSVEAQTIPSEPNIVFIVADDMRYDDLNYMPKTRKLVGSRGMRFKRAFVSNAMCCPSRATIMRGQYSHNNGVWSNIDSSDGGWKGYKNHGNEEDNVATRMRRAGYRTGLFGKYLNGYSGTSVPPGWTRWFATLSVRYFDYKVNDNGTIRHFGSGTKAYQTDVLRRQTEHFIGASVAESRPFFAYVTPTAPHNPANPAPRDEHTYDGEKAPRHPSFNEKVVSDKPPWISESSPLSREQIAQIDATYENRAETLQSLDDLVEGVVEQLRDSGVLDNTYIFFTSDNGWHLGEHRIPAQKGRPYEESIRMPLLVRGPRVASGSTTYKLTLNTDFLPTFTDLAGTKTPGYVDGRSLRPLFEGAKIPWRNAILLERHRYKGIRTASQKYVEYGIGFRELYALGTDPYELSNSYNVAPPPTSLEARLEALEGCAGDSCRAAEDK